MKEWSVKKKKLFEQSEFFFFSSASPDFSKIRAALTFWFFWLDPKEHKKQQICLLKFIKNP